jgi:uncharacterized membrane protein
MDQVSPPTDITDNDKLMAALSYPIVIVAIIILLAESMKTRPFQKFHAVQAIAVNIVVWVLYLIVSLVSFGFGALCFPVFWLVTLWPAYKAYQGEYMELPVITDFIKKQGWV